VSVIRIIVSEKTEGMKKSYAETKILAIFHFTW